MQPGMTLIIALSLGGALLSGCAEEIGTSQDGTNTQKRGQLAEVLLQPEPLAESDRNFVMEAAEIYMAEVARATLASAKGTAPVRQLAQQTIEDHRAASGELMKIASEKSVNVFQQTDDEHDEEMDQLAELSGAGFDKEYLDGQIAEYRKAIAIFEEQAKEGADQALKQFAAETLPTLKAHLRMALELQRKMP